MGHVKIKNLKSDKNNSGFTLVELLIVVAILAILSITAYVAIQRSQVRVMNEKVTSDLLAIENALNQYQKDNGTYPTLLNPLNVGMNKNILCFDSRHTYSHNCEEAMFVQTQVDNELLTKRYLQEIPTDPRTGSRYTYGVTTDGQFYQLAGDHLNNDDTWQAEVVDNLDEGSILPSLIRAFDGPNFIADAGSYLPYSPDSSIVTGRLHALTGTVMVDGQPALEGDKIQAGSMIKTEADGAVAIYFSDGSVTHLDASSELRLLATSEVAKNDKEGIITKIRLKLFQGKIWNKVVRLAEKSEFNVETTTAIAGVRGTEFGIDAKADKITIFTGKVVARKKTDVEMKASNEEGQSMEFSVLGDDFLPTQETNSKQGQFFVYDIPAAQSPLLDPIPATPTEEQELIQKYYKETLGLSLMDLPYIIKAQGHVGGTYSIYVTFNGITPDDILKIKGFELYRQAQTTGVRLMKEGELENPVMTVLDYVYDDQTGAYKFELEYKKDVKNPFYDAEKDQMDSILLRAFQEIDVKTYSQISWPPIGLPPDPNEEFAHQFDNADLYKELEAVKEGQQGDIQITKFPPNILNLDAPAVELASNAPCVWSISPAGAGAFVGAHENVDKVMYAPLDPALKLQGNLLGENITTRFKQSQEQVTIKCEDPMDQNNYQALPVVIAYKVKSKTAEYEYGYLAKNNVNWNQANTFCNNSTEGGFDNWHLPTKTVYDKLIQADAMDIEEKNLCEFKNNACEDLNASTDFLLQDQQNAQSAWTFGLPLNDYSGFGKESTSVAISFRCVR